MSGLSDAEERAILDGILQDPAYAGHATLHVGLSSTEPGDDGSNITEPSGGGYARVAITAAEWAAATGSAPATKANSAVVTFAQASADWLAGANLAHFVLMDAATVGNMVESGALGTAKPVLTGDTPSFAAGALVLKMGDPGDSF